MIPMDLLFSLANTAVIAFVVWMIPLNIIPVLIWLERKGSAVIQDRVGPNRASILGFRLFGMLHNIADVIKLLMKEDVIPNQASRFYYLLAPFWFMTVALIPLMVMPLAASQVFGNLTVRFAAADPDAGALFILAITGLGVYGVILAGWASNNKFSLLGGLRASAQMISYELTMGLAVVGILMAYGTPRLSTIVEIQGGMFQLFGMTLPLPNWGIFLQPFAFLFFLVAAFAETNRNPFDLPEGESELVAGYHLEYSSMKFALFFMAEYANMVVSSMVIATLFLGGYQVPFLPTETLMAYPREVIYVMLGGLALGGIVGGIYLFIFAMKRERYETGLKRLELFVLSVGGFASALVAIVILVFVPSLVIPTWLPGVLTVIVQISALMIKTLFFCWLFIWVRWTLPRFRYDQLMSLGWKVMLPAALANVFLTGLLTMK